MAAEPPPPAGLCGHASAEQSSGKARRLFGACYLQVILTHARHIEEAIAVPRRIVPLIARNCAPPSKPGPVNR